MAGGDIECREQRGRTVTLIIVGSFGDLPRSHGKHWLAAIKRLYLGFLIDAQHDGMGWRGYVEADNIAHLVDKIRVGRELEASLAVGLEAKGPPDTLHRRSRKSARPGHPPRTPVRGIVGQAFQCLGDHGFDPGIVNCARCARSRLIAQAIKPVGQKAPPPFADGNRINAQLRRNVLVVHARRTAQHDPRPHRQRLCRLAAVRQRLQFNPLRGCHLNYRQSQLAHRSSPSQEMAFACN
jgi:hypothetical protein